MKLIDLGDSSLQQDKVRRQRAITGILEHVVGSLELTDQQRDSVRAEYEDCSEHLSKSIDTRSVRDAIFPQGSMRLRTTIRPLRSITDRFDLDLVYLHDNPGWASGSSELLAIVGRALKEKYSQRLVSLPKGWRIKFDEREYHLDVIPALRSKMGGSAIAIADDGGWKDSDPVGYADWFELKSNIKVNYKEFEFVKVGRTMLANASVEPLPEFTEFKSSLHRVVQISKRHRDYHFNKQIENPRMAPSSIVVTTCLAMAYEQCSTREVFQSGFDLLVRCVQLMPQQIAFEARRDGTRLFVLKNPSLSSENLVERWDDGVFAYFVDWCRRYIDFLKTLEGEEVSFRKRLSQVYGNDVVDDVFAKQARIFNEARNKKFLTVSPTAGLTVGAGVPVAGHCIHGVQ